MKDSSVKKAFSIRHEPLGEQHPYEPLSWERTPRLPASGDPVILGVGTDRDHTADSVWCEWWDENIQIHHRAESMKRGSDETYDYWQINLPAFTGGETIQYCIYACKGDERVQTKEFKFTVMKWVDIESILCVEDTASGSTVFLQTMQPDLQVRLDLDLSKPDRVSLRFSKLEAMRRNEINSNRTESFFIQGEKIKVCFSEEPFGIEIQSFQEQLSLKCEDLWLQINQDGNVECYRFEFYSPSDEAFYGFGERFNALDQRGNCLINHLFAQYLHQGERSYIPIPFFISSHIYGFWLDTAQWAKFDLAADKPDRWMVEGAAEKEGSTLKLVVFFQKDPYSIVKAFTGITGKPALPPPWVFGLWISSNDWNSQEEVLRQLELCQQHQILSTVLVIEAWSDESTYYIWNGAQFSLKPFDQSYQFTDFSFPQNGHWLNLKEMVRRIHASGSHLVLWQIPVLKLSNPDEHLDETQSKQDREYAISKRYVVHLGNGTPHSIEGHMPWFSGSSLLDFTNPEAEDWWFKKRAYLLDELDIDGFKTDGGEHIWDIHTSFFNGERGKTGVNRYPLWYQNSYNRFLEKYHRKSSEYKNDRVLFSRSGYTGIQQYSCHWAGDEESTWDAFSATIRAMLNVGLSGVSFIGWDIAGFAGEIPTSELYLRAAAFSVFCPIMQFHSDVNVRRKPSRDRTPWNIQERTGDSTVIPTFRFFTNLRMNLLPYLLSEAWKSSQTGIPLMRAFPLAFVNDSNCKKYPYQYLFGDALLVAPIIEPGVDEIALYLPQGEWQDIWERKIYSGQRELRIRIPIDRIAVFQRKGSILPLNLGDECCLGSFVGNSTEQYKHLFLRIYSDNDEKFPLYLGSDGTVHYVNCHIREHEKTIEIDIPTMNVEIQIELIGVHAFEVSTVLGTLNESELDSAELKVDTWMYAPSIQSTQIKVPAKRNYDQIWIKY